MLTCPICGVDFTPKRPQGGGSKARYCSRNCRWKAQHLREQAEAQQAGRPVGCKGESVKFFAAPVDPRTGDDWPKGCAFSMQEVSDTLRLGYFPTGAKFRTKAHKVYTVRGKQAVSVDGEVIA